MADLTLSSLDSLLGVLAKTIKEEAKLLGELDGDVQFIRDEMDSMNGFLLHLTKSKTPHDDSMRAWMKQVRDLTYVADDYIKLYLRGLARPRPSRRDIGPYARYLYEWLRTWRARRELAGKIRELKERARQVGERRLRYGVAVPQSEGSKSSVLPIARDTTAEENKEEFLLRLEHGGLLAEECFRHGQVEHLFQDAIERLPYYGPAYKSSKAIEAIRDKVLGVVVATDDDAAAAAATDDEATVPVMKTCNKDHVELMKLLLRALYAYPYGTKEEVEELSKNLETIGANVEMLVMIFCYSKLSMHSKSCLQYLITFKEEESISRTSLVRRWLAEGLVARDTEQHGPDDSWEEAAERCFDELVFRGFICPSKDHPHVPTSLKLKSCVVHKLVNKFIPEISKSDNFVAHLPTHFQHQLEIRKMARQKIPPQQQQQQLPPEPCCHQWSICGIGTKEPADEGDHDDDKLLPMDKMVKFLDTLPEEYRLNVIDLGGCGRLDQRHLKRICKVTSLKYLSLRKTNVSRLPSQMNDLWQLETLDIRQTKVDTMSHIFIPGLKHLLAGNILADGKHDDTASAVALPSKLASTTQILRYIQIKDSQAKDKLQKLLKPLKQLRKLGVVLNGTEDNITHLLEAVNTKSESLRSLSVWFTEPPQQQPEHNKAGDGRNTGGKEELSLPNKLESLNLKCFNGSNIISGYIPQWINGHQKLSKITLRNSQLTGEELRQLGKLESLRCLRLLEESYIEPEVILKNEEFKELRFLSVDKVSKKTTKLAFEDGAATKLETVICNFHSMSVPVDHISGIRIPPKGNLRELKINGENFFKPSPSGTSFQ